MASYKLGKRPARKGAISFKFGDYFDRSALPTPPLRIGHEKIGTPWPMLANDKYSCCVFASAAHQHMTWTHMGGKTALFSDANVLADYAAVTGFKPDDPDSDAGTDMGQAMEYRRKIGIIDQAGMRHKVDAYVDLRAGEPDDAALGLYLTGGVSLGLQLPTYAMDQFEQGKPWVPMAKSGMEGGHCVDLVTRNSDGNYVIVTWGRLHAMSPEFLARYSDEAALPLSLEILRDKVSPDGFDESTLRRDVGRLAKQ